MKKPPSLPDTNFILRYLLRDIAEQFAEAELFFEKVRLGKATALIVEPVLVECLYILTKYYAVSRSDTAKHLTTLLQYKGMVNNNKEVLVRFLALFAETALDPVDCLLAARAATGGNPVLTFDKGLLALLPAEAKLKD